jgi:hypothetical protein
MPIVESGAASLGIGAISDGQYLKRSGTDIIGATSISSGGPSIHGHVMEIFDGLTTGDINAQGTYYECSSWARTAAAGGSCNVAVKSGADKMLSLFSPVGAGTSSAEVAISSTIGIGWGGARIKWKMRIDQDAASFAGGWYIKNAAAGTVMQLYFRYSSGWKLSWSDGSTITNFAGVPAKNTWYSYDLLIRQGSVGVSNANIYVDGAYVIAKTGGSAAHWPTVGFYCTNAAAVGDLTLDVDDLYIYNVQPIGLG